MNWLDAGEVSSTDAVAMTTFFHRSMIETHVLRLLCRGHREQVQGGMIGWQFDDPRDLLRQIDLLQGYMNGLYVQLELSAATGKRVSQEVTQLIKCSLQ